LCPVNEENIDSYIFRGGKGERKKIIWADEKVGGN